MSKLDTDLLTAHEQKNTIALVALYQQAAAQANTEQATAFYLTHAHVFAMEINHPDRDALRARLIEMGREVPLEPRRPPFR